MLKLAFAMDMAPGQSLRDETSGVSMTNPITKNVTLSHSKGPYSEYTTAHEEALRLQRRGAKSIRIDKLADKKWWVKYVIEDDSQEARHERR